MRGSARPALGEMAFGKTAKDPFESRIGNLIEEATVGTLKTADWAQINHICDVINSSEEGPKEAVRALRKRISGNLNHQEVRLSLQLIDNCTRICGPKLHSLIVRKDFVKDVLAKELKPKYNAPVDVQNHILHLIQSWATRYHGPVDMSDVRELYVEMKRKGLIFPTQDEASAGSWKNDRTVVSQGDTSLSTSVSTSSLSSSANAHTPHPRNPIRLVPEQVGKLYSELDMVATNISVLSAILLENTPGCENPHDMELLQKLQLTCRAMQERIVVLLLEVDNEEVVSRLIEANDALNHTFLQYERFQRRRERFRRMEDEAPGSLKDSGIEPSAPSSTYDLINFTHSAPVALGPTSVPQYSNLSVENGICARQVGQCAVNPLLRNRALPDIPVHNAAKTQQPQVAVQSSVTDKRPEPLYANVITPQYMQPVPSAHSLLSKPAHPSTHTGMDQSSDLENMKVDPISLEFDPLSNSNSQTEAIYEDLDVALNRAKAVYNGSAK
ncbi:TOM1-like protein 1 isoform X2 [Stegostoma tigrinum]|uniref:TOM1-like protein 1 isoform X2 n=1 Tax=Stegostoma tigrinum TaxID=3053191 RepID=UPI00286FC176|nr:TOM1-like protein 1 isoform X2 [Stegostoma tigrinum]